MPGCSPWQIAVCACPSQPHLVHIAAYAVIPSAFIVAWHAATGLLAKLLSPEFICGASCMLNADVPCLPHAGHGIKMGMIDDA